MPPKFDASSVAYVQIKTVGGAPPPTASLAPKIGSFGLAGGPKKVGDMIAVATKDYAGLKVQVQLAIQNRQATISIIPSAAALVLQALKEPVRDRKKEKNVVHDGNITFDDILRVAHVMKERSLARELSGGCCEILGTARSIGCTVDGKPAQDVIDMVHNGEYDDQIAASQ